MQILYIIVGLLIVWVIALTIAILWIRALFLRLGKDVGKENLIRLLQGLIEIEKKNSNSIEELNTAITQIRLADKYHTQKMGLVKFNPFEEVGGEHSFSLCLLDGNNKGLVLTGLHTRDRTRVYLKEIKNGKGSIELSKDEAKALKLALNYK